MKKPRISYVDPAGSRRGQGYWAWRKAALSQAAE
jgi:hypothetical protein